MLQIAGYQELANRRTRDQIFWQNFEPMGDLKQKAPRFGHFLDSNFAEKPYEIYIYNKTFEETWFTQKFCHPIFTWSGPRRIRIRGA